MSYSHADGELLLDFTEKRRIGKEASTAIISNIAVLVKLYSCSINFSKGQKLYDNLLTHDH